MRGNSGFLKRCLLACRPSEGTATPTTQSIFSSTPTTSSQSFSLLNNQRRHFKMCTMLIVIVTYFVLISSTNAGPVYTRHRRMILSELNTSELQNGTEPDAGKCLHNGIQVSKATIVCEKKNGCRAIQKTGYCCPDYQCECERDGKVYESGAKIVDPETPCKICYCQGGEISCNSVTCYNRNDCQPKFIPGRCCPEYDNCPPLDELLSTTAKSFTNSNKLPSSLSSPSPPKLIPEIPNNPLGIKIKEITKPEEIRIINEKPKPLYPAIKPNGNSGANHTKIVDEKLSTLSTVSDSDSPTEIKNQPESKSSSENENVLENADVSDSVNKEDSLKTVRQTEIEAEKIESSQNMPEENSNSAEQKQQQGEEVVIVDTVDRNGQTQPIRVLGVEGLQRGDEVDADKHNIDNTDDNSKNEKPLNDVTSSDFEPEAAGSEIDVYVSKANPEISNKVTTEGNSENSISSSTPKEVFETVLYTSGPETSEERGITGSAFETVYHEASDSSSSNLSTSENPSSPAIPSEVAPRPNDQHHHSHLDDDDTTPIESNPAYPTIPDEDLSIYNREVLTHAEAEEDHENSHKSKSAIHVDESKGFSNKVTTEGPNDILSSVSISEKFNSHNVSTEAPIESEERAAPGEPFLIPEWERNATELILNHNETDKIIDDDNDDNDLRNQASIGIDPGSGSGFGQTMDDNTPGLHTDSEIEASADSPVHLDVENSRSSEAAIEPAYSNIFNPDQQLSSFKFQKALDAFHNFQKSLNLF